MFGINGFGRSSNNYYKSVYKITPIPPKPVNDIKEILKERMAQKTKDKEEWLRSLSSFTDAFLLVMFKQANEFEDGYTLSGGIGNQLLNITSNKREPNPKYEDIKQEILRRGLEVHTDNKKKKKEEN